ncbi:hypothetical protein RSAG8_04824, partial [Rhizoctonia solani AG-8 WAC10335]
MPTQPSKPPKRAAAQSFARSETPQKRPKHLNNIQGSTSQTSRVDLDPGSSPSPDDENEPDEVDELTLRWDQATLDFCRKMEKNLHAQPNALRLSELISKHRIGGAYIRAFGPGQVRGVVNLSEDPNARGNLRPLEQVHIEKLYRVFATPGAKSDHSSPIFLVMNSSTINPECLKQMLKCDSRDPAAEPPLLVLNHPTIARQQQLEEWTHSQRQDGSWLSESQLRELQQELETLRAENLLASLHNGFHRIGALEMVGKDLMNRQRELLRRIKAHDISVEEFEQRNQEIEADSHLATYRVEVYEGGLISVHDDAYIHIHSHIADGLPDELVNYLVRNEDSRPAKGMGVGEKTWWTAERILIYIKQAQDEGCASRAIQLEYAFTAWAKELAPNRFIRGPSMKLTTEMARTAHLKAEWAGDDPVSRLFTEPFTLEMVLDTRHAIKIYADIMSHKLTIGMLHPSGALLACRFWLSIRILMEIFNVHGAEGLEEAEAFIGRNSLNSLGLSGATYHWNRLHSRPQKIPSLLEYFTCDAITEFDNQYASVWQLDHGTRGMQWGEEAVVIAEELKRSDNYHHPHSLPILEYLLDEYSPTWTRGSQSVGSANNVHGWYLRPRGLHQIAMAVTMGRSGGPLSNGLQLAIVLLSDTRLYNALKDLSNLFANHLTELETRCNTTKSQSVTYKILGDYPTEVLQAHGGVQGLFEQLKCARNFLRSQGINEQITPGLIDDLYSQRPALFDLIDKRFWIDVDATQWLSGWNTSENRRFRNFNALFGWGMYCKHMRSTVDKALQHTSMLQLLQVCLEVAQAQGREPWWSNTIPYNSEEAPSPVPTDGYLGPEDQLENLAVNEGNSQLMTAQSAIKSTPSSPIHVSPFDPTVPALSDICKYEKEESIPPWQPAPPTLDHNAPTSRPPVHEPSLAHETPPPGNDLGTKIKEDPKMTGEDQPMFDPHYLAFQPSSSSDATRLQQVSSNEDLAMHRLAAPSSRPSSYLPGSPSHFFAEGVRIHESLPPRPHSSEPPAIDGCSRVIDLGPLQEHTPRQCAKGAVAYLVEDPDGARLSVHSMELNSREYLQSLRDTLKLEIEESQKHIHKDIMISGLLVNGFPSDKLLPGCIGQHVFHPLHDVQSMSSLINSATACTREALHKLEALRSGTRTQFVDSITNLVMGQYFAPILLRESLAPLIYHMKLSYVRLAAVCISSVGVPRDDALAEAVLMAICDKVFEDQSFEWKPNGDLILDASWTFPCGIVRHPSGGKTLVGNIEYPPEDLLKSIDSYLNLSPTCIAQGPTLDSAMAHAMTAGTIQELQTYAFNKGSSVICPDIPLFAELRNTAFNQGPQFGRFTYSNRNKDEDEPDAVATEMGLKLRENNTLPRTLQSRISCFSGGPFCSQLPWLALACTPSDAEGVLKHLVDARKALESLREEKGKAALQEWESRLSAKAKEGPGLWPAARAATSWGCNYM